MSDKFYDESLGLELKIEKHMDFSDDYFVIYLVLDNKLPIDRKINIPDTTYVNSNREQLEQYHWESGYIKSQDILKPNSFKKAGLLYEKDKLKSISNNDLIYLTIELPDEGKLIKVSFKKDAGKWLLVDKEIIELEIKLSSKQKEKLFLKKIERLDAFEEKFGVSLNNISVQLQSRSTEDYYYVFIEVHSSHGTTINERIKIEGVLYDKDGLIIEKERELISTDDFFGFEIIKLIFCYNTIISINDISKVRIYPKNY